MEIPGKKEFQAWVETAGRCKDEALALADAYSNEISSGEKDIKRTAESFVLKLMSLSDDHIPKLFSDNKISKWIESEPSYLRAGHLMFRNAPPPKDRSEVASLYANRFLDRCDETGYVRWCAKKVAERINVTSHWSVVVIQAIYDYMFTDLNVIHLGRRSANKKLLKAQELINEAQSLMAHDLNELGLDTLNRELSRWISKSSQYPERDQQNKKEREFATKMAEANLRYGSRTAKPQVISELMYLSCFDRQLDLRTIARITSDVTKTVKHRQDSVRAKKEAFYAKRALAKKEAEAA